MINDPAAGVRVPTRDPRASCNCHAAEIDLCIIVFALCRRPVFARIRLPKALAGAQTTGVAKPKSP
jgi:hypothetical protein